MSKIQIERYTLVKTETMNNNPIIKVLGTFNSVNEAKKEAEKRIEETLTNIIKGQNNLKAKEEVDHILSMLKTTKDKIEYIESHDVIVIENQENDIMTLIFNKEQIKYHIGIDKK